MRAMPVLVVAVMVGVSVPSLAGSKTLVVGAGDCRDGVLLGSVRDFQEHAHGLLRSELFDHDEVLDQVRPQPTRSLEDLERQVQTARSLLYNAQNDRALELVRDALSGLERASPQVRPWPATASALMLSAQIYKNLDRPKESTDALRRIIRVDPAYQADPDAWPPSTVRALDAVRKELARGKRGLLQVTSVGVPGAAVFLDGREVGKTPLRLEVPAGTYRLALQSDEALSFPRVVTLGREEAVQVDLAFEGSLTAQLPLCLTSDDAGALKLATTVGASRLVVLRNTAPRGNPPYVSGVLYDVDRGERVRNAGIRPEQLRDLMMYLFTGKPDISRLPPPPEAAGEPPPPPLVQVGAGAPMGAGRIASFAALGLGAGAGLAGVLVFVTGDADRVRLEFVKEGGRLPNSGTSRVTFEESVDLMARIDANQAAALTLMGVGIGAAVAGVVGLVLFPAAPASFTVVPSPSGATVSMSGSF